MKKVLSRELYNRFYKSLSGSEQQPMIQNRSGLLAPTKDRTKKEDTQKIEPNDVARRYFKTINNMRMSLRDA